MQQSKITSWAQNICDSVGDYTLRMAAHARDGLQFCGAVFVSVGRAMRGRAVFRQIDLWGELEKAGIRAVPIACLISFMIGVIIAFVGVMQLEMFGAEIYVAALLAIATTRILGAIMTGIIMSGRTGAAYAAEIGSMQVNQEIDALRTMGVRPMDFLVLPRVLALTITMPILTIIADIVGILGGACIAMTLMNVSMTEYWKMTFEWITFNNFAIGVLHGWVYGWVIAICGCYCGLNTQRSADGIGRATTRAVVYSIVWCIVVTAILTLIFNWLDI